MTAEWQRAKRFFRRHFHGMPNFMTPEVLQYGMLGKQYAFELSTGEGLEHTPVYGITILKVGADGTTQSLHDCSRGGFGSRPEALAYLATLTFQLLRESAHVEGH